MKKFAGMILASATVVAITTCIATMSLAQAPPSVPSMISFQAEVTGPGGSPIADGAYPAIFKMFTSQAGVFAFWTENVPAVSVAGGVFTHNLGSVAPIPEAAEYEDSIWLEITFNGELQSPRIRLVSTPYSRLAGGLEVRSMSNSLLNVLATDQGDHRFSQYGSDGGEQIRLWGPQWGEVLLNDSSINGGTDEVQISSTGGNGGILRLRKSSGSNGATLYSGVTGGGATLAMTNDIGSATIAMDANQNSDLAVQVPGNAISAIECLNEPGVASDVVNLSLALSGAIDVLATRSLAAPSSGYVLAIGTCQATNSHTNGAFSTYANFGVSDDGATLPSNQDILVSIPSSAPTGDYTQAVTVQSIFSVSVGVNTFYLLGEEIGGDVIVNDRQLSLVFIPTSYGTVDPPTASGEESEQHNSFDHAKERVEAEAFDAARLQQELAIVRAQAEETTRRLAELEALMVKDQSNTAVAKPEN